MGWTSKGMIAVRELGYHREAQLGSGGCPTHPVGGQRLLYAVISSAEREEAEARRKDAGKSTEATHGRNQGWSM